MTVEDVAILLLAGGRSERFGSGDKLLADLNGLPLGLITAKRLSDLGWKQRIAVTSGDLTGPLSELGFNVLPATETGGIGDNIAKAARFLDASAVVIALADMPFITPAHVERLISAGKGIGALVATSIQETFSPPVLFGQTYFSELRALSGDAGARAILKSHPKQVITVEATANELLDIDTLRDLEAARTAAN